MSVSKPDSWEKKLGGEISKDNRQRAKLAKHDLSMRGMEAVRSDVLAKKLPEMESADPSVWSIGDLIKALPDGIRSSFSQTVTKLIQARNYESGDKPGDVMESMLALLEIQVQNRDTVIGKREDIRTTIKCIDRAVISALEKERNNTRNGARAA